MTGCQEIFSYWLNLLTTKSSVQMSLWFNIGRFCDSRNLNILSQSSNFQVHSCPYYSHDASCFYRIGSCIPISTSDFSSLNLFFFLSHIYLKISQFCWSFWRTNFWLHWFFSIVFLFFILLFSYQIFIFFFPFARFNLFFFWFLRVKLGCWSGIFLHFNLFIYVFLF